jgi:hypothetical protein
VGIDKEKEVDNTLVEMEMRQVFFLSRKVWGLGVLMLMPD